jgi:hypothetical protein
MRYIVRVAVVDLGADMTESYSLELFLCWLLLWLV